MDYLNDSRFKGLKPFDKHIYLASPNMHGNDELDYVIDAFKKNWITTEGENVNELEKTAAEYTGVKNVVALSCGTAALHLAIKLAAEKLYGSATGVSTPEGKGTAGALCGKRVFTTSMTFAATVNPIVYEGGEPVFIDSEYETWNMDPDALEKAFEIYPDVKLVVLAHLYGTPSQIGKIRKICDAHGALLIEDAAESLGATYEGKQTGSFGDYGVISFNGNKIITGSSGGMLLTHDEYSANKARKWSTQSREAAPWYQHEELGYNYRISNIIAGVVRGQWKHIDEHIKAKKNLYMRYKEGLKGLPIKMNPVDFGNMVPNYWLSCAIIDKDAMCATVRSENKALFTPESGKSCPTEILEALSAFNVDGRPIWKPMHLQPIYANNAFITSTGSGRGASNAYIAGETAYDKSADIFNRGLCLPSDIKMTPEDQDVIIEVIRRCFQ